MTTTTTTTTLVHWEQILNKKENRDTRDSELNIFRLMLLIVRMVEWIKTWQRIGDSRQYEELD